MTIFQYSGVVQVAAHNSAQPVKLFGGFYRHTLRTVIAFS
jgi:hypothetical protein